MLRDHLYQLIGLVLAFALVVGFVLLLDKMGVQGKSYSRSTFEQVCAEAKGKTVWNGRNLECIK